MRLPLKAILQLVQNAVAMCLLEVGGLTLSGHYGSSGCTCCQFFSGAGFDL